MKRQKKPVSPTRKMHYISNTYIFIVSIIFLTFIVLNLFTSFRFYNQTKKYSMDYNRSAVTGLQELLLKQEDNFMYMITGAYEKYFSYRGGIFSIFNMSNPDSCGYQKDIYRFINESYALDSELSAITIYAAGDNHIYSITRQKKKQFDSPVSAFSPLVACYKDSHTVLNIQPSTSDEALELSRSYSFIYCLRDPDTKKNIGSIQLDYCADNIQTYLDKNYPDVKGDFLIITSTGDVLFDTTGQYYDHKFASDSQICSEKSFSDKSIKLEGKHYYVNMSVLSYPHLRVVGFISPVILASEIIKYVFLMICITFVLILFTGICIYLYLHTTGKQLKHIYDAMLKLQNGELNSYAVIDIKHHNELTDIALSFNKMLAKLNQYIDEVFLAEIQNQKYQLKALQMQINPHFLYNTLETIRMRAVMENVPDISEMVFILSRIFRNSIKGNGTLTVRQEIDNCKNYLRLCSIQYQNMFRFSLDVQDSLWNRPIIQHALLVMIENYIMHGFDSTRSDNLIEINGAIINDHAVFKVIDNGFGIPKDTLEKLQISFHSNTDDDTKHIGLKNIYQRMKLLYHGDCSLEIISEEFKGTTVIFTFSIGDEINDSRNNSRR